MLTPNPPRIQAILLKSDAPNDISFKDVLDYLVAFNSWMNNNDGKYQQQSDLLSRVTACNIFRDKTFNLQGLSHRGIDGICFFSENEQYPSQGKYLPVFYIKKSGTNKYYRYGLDIRLGKERGFMTQSERVYLSKAFSEYAKYLKGNSVKALKKTDGKTVEEKAAAILATNPGYVDADYKKAIHDISSKIMIAEAKVADLESYIALRVSQYESLTQLPSTELSDWRKDAVLVTQELDKLREQSGIDTIHADMKNVIDLVRSLHNKLKAYRNSGLSADSRQERRQRAAGLSHEIGKYREEKNNLKAKLIPQKRALEAYQLLLSGLENNPQPPR